jgi:hypothetical protein
MSSTFSNFSINSFLQGMSQQASQISAPLTVKKSNNFLFNPVEGVMRKPPFVRLFSELATNVKYHLFVSPFTGNLTMVKLTNPITVTDLITGNNIPVTQASSTNAYVGSGGISFSTLGDYIVMFSKNRTVATTSIGPTTSNRALIFCRGSFVASTTYRVRKIFKGVSTVVAEYTTGSLNPETIASDLRADIASAEPTWGAVRVGATIMCNPNPGLTQKTYAISGTTCTITDAGHSRLVGDVIHVDFLNGTNNTSGVDGAYTITAVTANTYSFTHVSRTTEGDCTVDWTKLTVEDGGAGELLRICQGSVETLSYLPKECFDGFEILVSGSADSEDKFYVRFQTTSGTSEGSGLWVESSKPEDRNQYTANTIPHGLKFNQNGSIVIEPLPLGVRRYGDKDSNPDPYFVGTKIRDIRSHKGRTAILTSRGVDLSDSADPFAFYRDTTKVLKDSAPISLLLGLESLDEEALYITSFQGELLIYTTQAIFALFTNQEDLTPSSATINKQANIAIKEDVRPVGVSSTSLAITPGVSGLKMIETFRQEVGLYVSNSLSEKVPYMISPDCSGMEASHRLNMVWVANGDNLISYQYIIEGQERKQQAFGFHSHPYDELEDMLLLDEEGLLVTAGKIGGLFCVHTMDLNVNSFISNGLPYQIHLDDQIICNQGLLSTQHPELNIPYNRLDRPDTLSPTYLNSNYLVVGFNPNQDKIATIAPYITDNYIYIPTEYTQCVFGKEVESYLELHTAYPEDRGGSKILSPMQLHRMGVQVVKSGGMTLTKTNPITLSSKSETKLTSTINTPISFIDKLQILTKMLVFESIGINTMVDLKISSYSWFPLIVGKITFQGENHETEFGL